jgi:hypothetical protein
MDRMEVTFIRQNKEQMEQAARKEAELEERLLRSVNDQVDAAMARVQATPIKDLTEKVEIVELRVGQ